MYLKNVMIIEIVLYNIWKRNQHRADNTEPEIDLFAVACFNRKT